MHVVLGTLADYAVETGHGKLTLVGVFDTIYALQPGDSIPLPEAALVIVLSASIVEGTDHQATITLEDADANPLGQFDVPLLFNARGLGYPTRAQLIVNLRGFKVPQAGDYVFRLRVNGAGVAEVPFYVAHAPQQGSSSPVQS